MNPRYRCLVLDHDDTVVNSTLEVNYPNMLDSLAILRPQATLTLEEFIEGNSDPGFNDWVRQRFGYTQQEVEWHYEFWRSNVMKRRPSMAPGMPAFLTRYHRAGGIICVATHSMRQMIEADYRTNCGFLPDYMNCWEEPAGHRKPNPYPVQEALRRFDLRPADVLVVDDLGPGLQMAEAAGVDFAAALWCCTTPKMEQLLSARANYVFRAVGQLEELVLGPAPGPKEAACHETACHRIQL